MTVRSVAVNLTANVGSYVSSMRAAAAQTTAIGDAAEQASVRAAAAAQALARTQLASLQAQNRAAAQLTAQQRRLELAQRQADAAARSGTAAQQAAAQANLRRQQQAMDALKARTAAEQAAQRTAVGNAREQALLARQQQQAAQQLLRQQQQAHASMQATGVAVGVASAALVAFGVAGIKRAAEFEQAMSHVKAVTNATSVEMGHLRQAAIDAGQSTVFTAKESANAIEEMAKAGVSTRDILNGGLTGALNLAAAGSIGVADAAEMASSAMVQFGLHGDQVSHVADLMSAAANKAQGSVQDVSTALSYVGPVAAQAGMSIESTVGAIAELQNNGIMAEKAGTGLRGMLLSLQSPSVKASKEMEDLGVNVYDATGKMLGWDGIAQVLHDRLGNLSEAQRNYALGVIFSNAQLPAAISLMKGGAQAADAWTKGVNDNGNAARTASTNLDNLYGDIEKLKGALDTAFISGGSGGLKPLRLLTQGLDSVISGYDKLDSTAQGTVSGVALVTGAMGLASAGLLIFTPRLLAAKTTLADLGTTAPRAAAGITMLGKAAAGLGILTAVDLGLGTLALSLEKSAPGINAATAAIIALNKGSADALNGLFQTSDGVKGFANSVKLLSDPGMLRGLDNTVGHLFTFGRVGNQAMDEARKQIGSVDAALAQLAQGGHAKQAADAYGMLAAQAAAAGISGDRFRAMLPQYADALKGLQNQANLAAGGVGALNSANYALNTTQTRLTSTAKNLSGAWADLIKNFTVMETGAADQEQANEGWLQSLNAVTDSVKQNGKSLDLHTEKGRANRQAILSAAQALGTKFTADLKAAQEAPNSAAAIARVTGRYKEQRDALVDQAVKAGLSRTAAQRYIDAILKTPKEVKTDVHATGIDRMERQIADLQHQIDVLTGKTIEIKVNTSTLGGQVGIGSPQAPPLLRPAGHAVGGYISGPGGPTDDMVPALLSNGEYVVRASAVRALGVDTLDELNRYATGGLVQQPDARTPPIVVNATGMTAANIAATMGAVGGFVGSVAGAVASAVKRQVAQAAATGGLGSAGGGTGASLGNGLYRPVHGGRLNQGVHDVSTGFPAIDIGVPVGTTVYAAADGRVGKSYDIRGYEPRRPGPQDGYRSYGRVIEIISRGFSTLYAHLSSRGVGAGQQVRGGQPIGLSGNTGNSTGPHLHFGAAPISPTRFWASGQPGGRPGAYAAGGLVRRGYAAGGKVRRITEDSVPGRSPKGGRLVDYHDGMAWYSDGYTFSAAGWRKGQTRVSEDSVPTRSVHGAALVGYGGGTATYADQTTWSKAGWGRQPTGGLPAGVPAMPATSASSAQWERAISNLDAYTKRWEAANAAADAHAQRLTHVQALTKANAEVSKAEAAVAKAAKSKGKDDDRQAKADLQQARADRAQAARDLRDYDAQARRDATQRALDARAARLQQQRDAAAAREQAAAERAQKVNDRTGALTQGDLTQRQLVEPAPSTQAVLLNAQDAVAQLIEWDRDIVALRKRGLSQTSISTLGLEDGPQMLGLARQLMRATGEQIKELNHLTWTRIADARRVASGKHLAGGGYVSGPGTGTSDSVPAMLSNGEFVVRAAAASRYRTQLEHMNRYAGGGIVRAGAIAPPPVSVNVAGTDTWQLQVEMRRTRQAIERQTVTLSQQTAVVAVGV